MLAVAAVAGVVGLYAAWQTRQLFKKKLENDQQKAKLAELKAREKIDKSLEDPIKYLIEIEEIRVSLTKEKTKKTERYAEQAEYLSESLGEAREKIDFQLTRVKLNYEVLLNAGNVQELSDGTYEVINLSVLTATEELAASRAIHQDNAYITKSHKVKDVIDKLVLTLDEEGKELTLTNNSTGAQLLERIRFPEALYKEALNEVIATYRPEREIESGTFPPEIRSESGRTTEAAQYTSQRSETESGFRSPSERLLELAEKSQKTTPKAKREEMEMG